MIRAERRRPRRRVRRAARPGASTTTSGCGSPGTTPFDVVDEPLVAYRVGHANLSRRQLDRLHVARSDHGRFRRHYDGDMQSRPPRRCRAECGNLAPPRASSAAAFPRRCDSLGAPGSRPFVRLNLVAGVASRPRSASASPLLQFVRRVRGRDGAWEQHCHTSSNRPEPIL